MKLLLKKNPYKFELGCFYHTPLFAVFDCFRKMVDVAIRKAGADAAKVEMEIGILSCFSIMLYFGLSHVIPQKDEAYIQLFRAHGIMFRRPKKMFVTWFIVYPGATDGNNLSLLQYSLMVTYCLC